MSSHQKDPGGASDPASGQPNANEPKPNGASDPVDPPADPGEGSQGGGGAKPNGENVVAYETHRKLLAEKKKLQERVEKFEADSKAQLEQELKEKEDFKKLAELKEQEAREASEKLNHFTQREIEAKKLSAVLNTIGNVDRKYWDLIDIDKVVINPDTQEIDEMSVTKYAEDFKKQYFEILQPASTSKLPNSQPKQGGSITYEEWLKLPAKEMKARYHEVIKRN